MHIELIGHSTNANNTLIYFSDSFLQLEFRLLLNFCRGNFIHTTLGKCENGVFFLRFGLPSTLIRHENRAFDSLRKQPSFFAPGPSGVSREGRPSRETPLGPGAKKDGCFRRLSFRTNFLQTGSEEFKNSDFSFLCGRKTFCERNFLKSM